MRRVYLIAGTALSVFTLSILFSNCSKERIEPDQQLEEYEEADEYLESKKVEEQEYEITEEGDGPLIGNEGTKIWISKDILMYPNGDSVHFPYTIKLIELYTPEDMIYYQMPSMSDNALLSTHGYVRVRAFKDNVELVLRPDKYWLVEMPRSNPESDMLIYNGAENNADVNWVDKYSTAFTATAYGYYGEIKELGWIACAKDAIGSTQTVSYSFYSDSISLDNLSNYIYLPEKEALMQVIGSGTAPLPLDESMKIIVFAKQGEQLFSFYTEGIVGAENRIEIVLSTTTDAALTATLVSL
jgi:hypothetical protein